MFVCLCDQSEGITRYVKRNAYSTNRHRDTAQSLRHRSSGKLLITSSREMDRSSMPYMYVLGLFLKDTKIERTLT